METETRKALKICLKDAYQRNLGVCVYETQYGPLIDQIRRDLNRARELGLSDPPFHIKNHSRGDFEVPWFKVGEIEFISNASAFTAIYVAGCAAVYYDSGIGGSGSYSNMTLGKSLLPGPWMDDIVKAARVLSEVVAKGGADLAVKEDQETEELSKAEAFLASRRA